MQNNAVSGTLSYEQTVELIEQGKVETCVDMGHSFLFRLLHPKHGSIALVTSAFGDGGWFQV